MVGVTRDRQFGPTVMLGVGGVLAEAIADVVFRPAPVDTVTAHEMLDELASQRLLGPFRGEAAVDRDAVAAVVEALGRLARRPPGRAQRRRQPADRHPGRACRSPSTRSSSSVVIGGTAGEPNASDPTAARHASRCEALFEPRGVLVTGASAHPGKFGFVALHNLLAERVRRRRVRHQPAGRGGPRCADGARGRRPARTARSTSSSSALQRRRTSSCCGPARRRASRRRSSRRRATARRARTAGVPRPSWSPSPTSSTSCSPVPTARASSARPVGLCAQIVAPYPPAGRIAVASQSGNFVSSFMNYARATGVGHQPGGVGRQRRRRLGGRLPRLLRRRPGHRGRARLPRGDHRRAGAARPPRRRRRPQAAGAREGRGDRGRGAGRGEPHRRARRRRQGVRRRVPRRRHHRGPPPSRRRSTPRPPSPPNRPRPDPTSSC